MDYELAKKLKDAGFPQAGDGYGLFEDGDKINVSFIGAGNSPSVYVPTLSELIEACGESVSDFDLRRSFVGGKNGVVWHATLLQRNDGERLFQGSGPTPKEAVANLLLALRVEGEEASIPLPPKMTEELKEAGWKFKPAEGSGEAKDV